MPTFYFHTDDEQREGVELESVAAAKCEAIRFAGRLICDEADSFWNRAEWKLTVKDETGLILFQLWIIGTEAPIIGPRQASPQPSN